MFTSTMCNHICPGMLYWAAAVPSCLLNNYGSILGADNIDRRRCRSILPRDASRRAPPFLPARFHFDSFFIPLSPSLSLSLSL